MWFDNFEFYDKLEGLTENPPANFFSRQLTDAEIELYPDIKKIFPDFVSKHVPIPSNLKLTDELRQLLQYSNGGGIINGDREFGYFALQDIRYYYFAYGFPKYTPYLLPIAFNGGGVFYAYDFRDNTQAPIIAVASNNADYDCIVTLGRSLREVLSKTSNIEDEMVDVLY